MRSSPASMPRISSESVAMLISPPTMLMASWVNSRWLFVPSSFPASSSTAWLLDSSSPAPKSSVTLTALIVRSASTLPSMRLSASASDCAS